MGTGGSPFKPAQIRLSYIRSLNYHLVELLGTRIDVIQPQIRNLIVYLLPLPDKKTTTTAVVKRDKTSGLDRNDRQKLSRLQRTLLIRKGSIQKCGLLLLWARLKISCISRICCVWNNVCVHVCETTNYSVVINCGWNNNVAVKIVSCWNLKVFTASSWLDRHGEFVFTKVIHVRRDPPHSNSSVRSSILSVRVGGGRCSGWWLKAVTE